MAASIAENSSKDTLIIRDVTAMPNLTGLLSLITLMFAPQVEIRRNHNCTRYTNILCGLGFDEATKKSYFAEHDAVVHLDVEMDLDDLEKLNHMRYVMSQLVYLQPLHDRPEVDEWQKSQLKLKLKELVIK